MLLLLLKNRIGSYWSNALITNKEVGLDVTADQKLCEIPSQDQKDTLHFWRTTIVLGNAKINSKEATELRWITFDEMKTLQPMFEADLEIFKRVQEQSNESI